MRSFEFEEPEMASHALPGLTRPWVRGFRLAFSFAPLEQLKEGIRLIGEALAEG